MEIHRSSNDSYEASALPPSYHGWIKKLTFVFFDTDVLRNLIFSRSTWYMFRADSVTKRVNMLPTWKWVLLNSHLAFLRGDGDGDIANGTQFQYELVVEVWFFWIQCSSPFQQPGFLDSDRVCVYFSVLAATGSTLSELSTTATTECESMDLSTPQRFNKRSRDKSSPCNENNFKSENLSMN